MIANRNHIWYFCKERDDYLAEFRVHRNFDVFIEDILSAIDLNSVYCDPIQCEYRPRCLAYHMLPDEKQFYTYEEVMKDPELRRKYLLLGPKLWEKENKNI